MTRNPPTMFVRFLLLIAPALLVVAAASPAAGEPAAAVRRPNVIFFVVDDDRRYRTNYLPEGRLEDGSPRNVSPTVDRLAAEGTVFQRFYASTPICIPSRFTALTGTYGSRAGNREARELFETHGYPLVGQNVHILPETPTVAKMLRDAGYATGMVGKNHVVEVDGWQGFARDADPADPAVLAQLRRNHDLVQQAFYDAGFDYAERLYHENLAANQPPALRAHNLGWITQGALEFIDAHADGPFFLYYASTLPHGPNGSTYSWDADRRVTSLGLLDEPVDLLSGPDEVRDRLRAGGLDPEADEGRDGLTILHDDVLAALIDKLEAEGVLDDTVIVLFNDHGLEGGKSSLYEGGMRTSAVFWGPGIEPQTLADTLGGNVDFLPTFLDLAGVAVPEDATLDGVSLKPVLDGSADAARETVYGELGYSRAVVGERYKYIALRPSDYAANVPLDERRRQLRQWFARRDRLDLPRGPNQPTDPYPHTFNIPGGTDNNWPAMRRHPHYFDADQLYDLQADPREKVNLADDPEHADVLAEMKAHLARTLATLPGSFGEFTDADQADQADGTGRE